MTAAIREKTKLLGLLQNNVGPENMAEQKRLHVEIGFLLDIEDIKWKQRAKRHWLEGWDRNTKFYHAFVNQRRKKNTIRKVVDDEEQCLQGVEERILDDMRGGLDKAFTSEEVVVALKRMSPFKSPRPYDFGAEFYQDHWERVGGEVVQTILEFFQNGKMPRDLNHTYIALIPK
ncbi:hypothetical protein F2P56_027140, partial [Juglans regia]